MSLCHIIKAPLTHTSVLADCTQGSSAGDIVVFHEVGVLWLTSAAKAADALLAMSKQCKLYALAVDCQQYHVDHKQHDFIQAIADTDFIKLLASHYPIINWS